MKSNLFFSYFLLLSIVCIPLLAVGQFTVTKVTGQNVSAAGDGFYYSLPRTLLQVDLTVEKIEQIRGPLAEYTENYLGTNDFITSNSNSYKVLNLNIKTLYEADPNQVYYVQFPIERSKEEKVFTFQLSELGTLLAFDHEESPEEQSQPTVDQTIIVMEGSDDFQFHPDYHRKKKTDTITRKITIDTVSIERFLFKTSWVDKSTEDKANEAALQIANIRDARFNLLTGYQEVNYGESMKYMDYQLSKMESKYLELFLGKEVKTYENHSVYYLPKKNTVDGVLLNLAGNSNVEISVTPRGNTALVPEAGSDVTNKLFYRIPEMVDIEISYNGIVLHRSSIPISQLGVVAAAPLTNTRTQFDPQTGSLTKIVRE